MKSKLRHAALQFQSRGSRIFKRDRRESAQSIRMSTYRVGKLIVDIAYKRGSRGSIEGFQAHCGKREDLEIDGRLIHCGNSAGTEIEKFRLELHHPRRNVFAPSSRGSQKRFRDKVLF